MTVDGIVSVVTTVIVSLTALVNVALVFMPLVALLDD